MVFSVPGGKKILWDCRLSNLSLHKNTLVNNHCSLSGVRNLLYWKLKKKKKNSSSLACLRLNTWFELAEDTKNIKYFFFILTRLFLHSIGHCSFRKPEETFFFYTSPTKLNSGNCSWQLSNKSTMAHNQHATFKKNSQFSWSRCPAVSHAKLSQGPGVVFKSPAVGLPVLCIFQFTSEGTNANHRVCGWM